MFTANVFALMGLRQLYFLLVTCSSCWSTCRRGGWRVEMAEPQLAFILAFIGVKLVLHALHENELPFINGGSTWRCRRFRPCSAWG